MRTHIVIGAALAGATLLSACAQSEPEPERRMVQPEPIYNKAGEVVGCASGEMSTGGDGQTVCVPTYQEQGEGMMGEADGGGGTNLG